VTGDATILSITLNSVTLLEASFMPLEDIYNAGQGCYSRIITIVACLEYMPLKSLHFLKNLPNKLECYITLSRKGFPGTNTSLLGPFIGYKENEV